VYHFGLGASKWIEKNEGKMQADRFKAKFVQNRRHQLFFEFWVNFSMLGLFSYAWRRCEQIESS
jgi:hypothetical protein